jgi:cytokinesis protein
MEKRKQAAEEAKANRAKAREAASAEDDENSAVLDTLLEKLRNGDNVGRRARRARTGAGSRPSVPLNLDTDSLLSAGKTGSDTADIALNMLAQLKSNGFEAITPGSPTASSVPNRRTRRRPSTSAFRGITEELEESPLFQDGALLEGRLSPDSPSDASAGTPEPIESHTDATASADEPN